MPRRCPACGADGTEVGTHQGWAIRRCTGCRTLFAAFVPAASLGGDDYETHYDHAVPTSGAAVDTLRGLVGSLEHVRDGGGTWLDIGCGAGDLLRAADDAGWDVEGVEVSGSAVRLLRNQGFNVWHGGAEVVERPDGYFDVVSLVEVLEHVTDPAAVLRRARCLVRPGGRLYLTTPHGRGISARLGSTRWRVVCPPEHLQLFSRRGLATLVTDSGLSVVDLRTESLDIGGLRALRRTATPHAGAAQVSIAANARLHASRRGRVAKRVANVALRATRLGDSLKLMATRP
jgi:SAM-dependent methyltransferase